ncbi:hypothetical protein D5125_02845 [Magnetovirga frankeli]|uniref:hypothetical protein n=1 Tax=Magnetovirga frankeli TaxID=947516 RepID=UPI001293D7D1|nr:hypothetical protein D5125_02845 [gamma proteobacterium SS-5]
MRGLRSLHARYVTGSSAALFGFNDAYKRYSVSQRQSLIDLTIVATSIQLHATNPDDVDPLIRMAIQETNPNFSPSLFYDFSPEEMTGILNAAKGKYFEYLVTNKLNAGEQVGDLQLPEGYRAIMAENANQPGWDLQIVDAQGQVSEYLQLKASNSLSYIKDTLDRYPDIQIISTAELADSANGLVLDSEITEAILRERVSEAIGIMDNSMLDSAVDAFNPLIPLAFILITEGYQLAIGKSSVTSALRSSRYRMERSIGSGLAGALVFAAGGGLLSIPSVFIAGGLYDQYREMVMSETSVDEAVSKMTRYRIYQQQRIMEL